MRPKRGEFDRPKRFYASASVSQMPDGYAINLDGRVPKTPGGALLAAPIEALAELVASEWAAQDEHVDIFEMPATRLLHTAIDAIPKAREKTARSLAEYAETDLVCYLADGPRTLVERQRLAWSPLLEWSRSVLGLEFLQTQGIVHQTQPAATLEKVAAIARRADDLNLAGLAFGASLFGSAVLVLALRSGRIDGPSAHAAARIDETFQEERWGIDDEAATRASLLLRDAIMLDCWFSVTRTD